ncbi:hypothetical protein HYR99_31365 [Candidatus Poribacteria bacterium]|nr:hypothetical protein [Candidatus Poribacteria bacterium]
MIRWHRLFGLALTDLFTDSPFRVELEKDLSLKQQLLDVVIIRKGEGQFQETLPDGLENLAEHNLLSYKSMQEAFDEWTVDELIGHYVNYRKQASPSLNELLPKESFRLYGVSTRFPQKLADMVRLEPLKPGVYQTVWGTHHIRLIVLSEIPQTEPNALWNLFSAVKEKVNYGATQYRQHATEMSSIINQLFKNYQLEGLVMPYTMEDFRRDFVKEHLSVLSADERLAGLSVDEILQRFSIDEILFRMSMNEILQRFSADEILRQFSVDEILQRFSADEILRQFSVDEIRQLSPNERRRLRQLLEDIKDE